jgi:hypothetical protein
MSHTNPRTPRTLAALAALLLLLFAPAAVEARQQTGAGRLPSPDKIVGEYLKAVGGKKGLAALRDATYEWEVRRAGAAVGTARTRLKGPSAMRTELLLDGGGARHEAANARSAWVLEAGRLSTLTDAESHSARLRAMLEAGRFVDFKKQKVLARTVGLEEVGGEPAYSVEFATRAGGRVRYWFSVAARVPLQLADETRRLRVRFSDWRARPGGPLLLEPHLVEIEDEVGGPLALALREARYNTGLADALFEPPSDASLDIGALLRDLARNQDEARERINDYTFTQKVTEREVTDKGVVKKQKVSVYEVYPVAFYGWVQKLVSEDGSPLPPERAAKEEKRVAEELEKAEREAPKNKAKYERRRAEQREKRKAQAERARAEGKEAPDAEDDEDEVEISTFLRACELISPRRETFRGRDSIVFDFRPRPGFRPSNSSESIVSKLSGIIWIDPAERQVIRLEARLVDGYKRGGGLVASIKSGSALVFERTRLPEGVWLPRFAQFNISARVFMVAGVTVNRTREFSDYKRFSTKTGDDKLDTPKDGPQKP